MDVKENVYTIKALLSSGATLDLTNVIDGQFEWGEQKGELAQRLTANFANAKAPQGNLSTVLSLCTRIYVYANGSEVFRGIEWDNNSKTSNKKAVPIIAYDKSKYLMQSEEQSFYPAGYSTNSIISDICKRWGITLSYSWQSWTHPKTTYRGSSSIADEIAQTISDAQKHISAKPVTLMDKDILYVRPKGSNSTVYVLREDENATSMERRMSMNDLVTRVVIYGKEDNDGRSSIVATVNGKTEYGILQKVVYQDGDRTLADAQTEANDILATNGAPTNQCFFEGADVPTMRKGDKVKIIGATLNGYFYIAAITHNGISRTMSLEVESI